MLFCCIDVMEILVAAMLLSIREMKNSQVLNRIDTVVKRARRCAIDVGDVNVL